MLYCYCMITISCIYLLENKRPRVKDVDNYVVIKCAANWKELGRHLYIHENFLNIIEKDNPRSCENCCSKMLSDWLESTPNASWAVLLDAVDKTHSKSTDTVEKLNNEDMFEKLGSITNDLSAKVGKLDMAADKLDTAADKMDSEVDRLPGIVEKLYTGASRLPNTVEKLDTMAHKMPDMVERLDTAANALPDTVEKLGSAVDKLPGAVAQLCKVVDQLPNMVGKIQITEDIGLDDSAGNVCTHTYVVVDIMLC